MKVEKLLRRLKIEFLKVNLIQASLDSILVFLSLNLVSFLFKIRLVGNFTNLQIFGGFSVVFFIADLIFRARRYNVEIYEEKNPELEEILRTARDNRDKSNIASQALFDDLVERTQNITSESIIPDKEIIQKVLAIGALSFLTLASGLVNLQVAKPTSEIVSNVDLPFPEGDSNTTDFKVRNASKILGEPSEIDVKARELQFEITGSGESTQESFSFDSASEEFTLEATRSELNEDMQLAKEYSLAVKKMK